ncbi:MAG: nucleotidyltransferase family protein [Thermodesulfobacteriota bacterium]
MKISAILLGAGESKRMGENKLDLPWGKKTILEKCLQTLIRSEVKEIVLVLNEKMKKKVNVLRNKKVKIVFNPDYRKGMSTSISRGLKVIDPKSQGILIALGDQPALKTRTINAIVLRFRVEGKGIIVPTFQGKWGHPVLFHRRYYKDLLKLKGDIGGKYLIQKNLSDVLMLPLKSRGIIQDIDNWKNYYEMKEKTLSRIE